MKQLQINVGEIIVKIHHKNKRETKIFNKKPNDNCLVKIWTYSDNFSYIFIYNVNFLHKEVDKILIKLNWNHKKMIMNWDKRIIIEFLPESIGEQNFFWLHPHSGSKMIQCICLQSPHTPHDTTQVTWQIIIRQLKKMPAILFFLFAYFCWWKTNFQQPKVKVNRRTNSLI